MGILIAYLLGILTASKPKNHNGDCEHRSTDCHENQPFPRGPFSVISLPRTLSVEEQAEKEKKEGRKTISFWVRIVSLGVLVIYAGVTILIWCANKKAADAAKSAADTAKDTLIASNRPWISVDVSPDSPLIFDQRGAVLMLKYHLKNVGHSVAKSVSIWSEMKLDNRRLSAEQEQLCAAPKSPVNAKSDYGLLLFPDQPPAEQTQPVIATPEEVAEATKGPIKGMILAYILICVDYQSAIEPAHHQTRLLRLPGYFDPRKNAVMGAFDPQRGIYPDIILLPQLHGDSAD